MPAHWLPCNSCWLEWNTFNSFREVTNGKDSIVADFRDFIGPLDPELAKAARPQSIRAIYGENKVKNGVHCTDLTEDGDLEVRSF